MTFKPLPDVLESALQDPADRVLVESILGTTDIRRITGELTALCSGLFGSGIDGCIGFDCSVGVRFGLHLSDGRKLSLKVHGPTAADSLAPISLDYLRALSHVHEALFAQGFPCPRVEHEPVESPLGFVSIERYERPGAPADAHQPPLRRAMAELLCELVERAKPYRDLPGFAPHAKVRASLSNGLYPQPHNALFDFEATGHRAEWIDELAGKAKHIMDGFHGETVLGHTDWSARHMRFADDRIVMVYDWDSLRVCDELKLVGIAAATFPTTWDLNVPLTPVPEEARQFVLDYEAARTRRFSTAEFQKIAASATYTMAYTARCEHCLDPAGDNMAGSFREALGSMESGTYF